MKVILDFIKPYKKLVVFVLLVMILVWPGGLLIPTITADIINYGIGSGDMDYIIQRGLLMVAVSDSHQLQALWPVVICAPACRQKLAET